MGKWFSDNLELILPAVAAVAFFAMRIHDRTSRGEDPGRSLLYVLFPVLDPDSHARRMMWANVFVGMVLAAIVIAILVAWYLFH